MSCKGHQTPALSNPRLTHHAPVTAHSPTPWQTSRPTSRVPSRRSTPTNEFDQYARSASKIPFDSEADSRDDFNDMDDRPSALHRPTDCAFNQPLLRKDDEERGRTGYSSPDRQGRPSLFSRRSTMTSRSPDTQAKLATRKKYTYAAFFLGLSLISFVIQTETAVYIQHELGWNKAYCML